jgi:hypothetical protein
MTCTHLVELEAADAEVEAARSALVAALETTLDDEYATELISAAARRLREGQVRQAAARIGVPVTALMGPSPGGDGLDSSLGQPRRRGGSQSRRQ